MITNLRAIVRMTDMGTDHVCEDADRCPLQVADRIRLLMDRYEFTTREEADVLQILFTESLMRLASPHQQAEYVGKIVVALESACECTRRALGDEWEP